MESPNYYPVLSSVFDFDDLPDEISFLKDIGEELLDGILLKKKEIVTNSRGDAYGINISLLTFTAIKCELFGSGLYLVLNPSQTQTGSNSTQFDITLDVKFTLLPYLNGLSIQNLSLDPGQILGFVLNLVNVSVVDLFFNAIQIFEYNNIQSLISKINSTYNLSPLISLDTSSNLTEDDVDSLVAAIDENDQLAGSNIASLDIFFNFYIAGQQDIDNFEAIDIILHPFLDGSVVDKIRTALLPQISASLILELGLEIPRSILIPVDSSTFQPLPITDPANPPVSTILFDRSSFTFSTNAGLGFDSSVSLTLTPTFAQIGSTGIIISFSGAQIDLSTTSNIPAADAAGYPDDFIGIFIQTASIRFAGFGQDDPNNHSATITASNVLIGTGGISGKITLADQGILYRKFGSFSAELDSFSLTFLQNTITDCAIAGQITLDKYTSNGQPAVIKIQAQIKDDGNFSITALPQANALVITLPNVFNLTIRSLTIGEQQPKGFYIEVAGTLDFIAHVPVLGDILPKGINITKLRIWDNGDIEFSGGGLVIPKSFKLQIGPVKMEISNISLGSYNKTLNGVDRSYRYFGFDGMVNTGNAGVDVKGNGIKYYFTVDDGPGKSFDNFIRIDGIAIDIIEPGDASPEDADFILKGFIKVSTPDPNVAGSTAGTEYAGSVAVSLPQLGVAGSAGMRLDPSIPSFLVDIGLELSMPILLGSTGLGIYGFRGLIGKHYVPSKSAVAGLNDDSSWWDWYKAKNVPDGLEGIEIDKFANKQGFSLGAGITIATSYDAGFTFSSKLFIMLGLPDVFLIAGQAGILRSRIGLTDKVDPPFSALIAIDSTSFTGDLSVNYKLPSGGEVFSLQGTLALAFFFNNASGWYINLGQDQPESARIQAKILTLFKGYAYVMISAKGFKAGAGASFNFNKSFGPVGVSFGASLDLGAYVSFTPIQIGGFIQFGGYANLKLFWLKIGFSIQVALAVEAPHPFNITGSLAVKIHTPWPLPNIHFTLSVSWTISNDRQPLLNPIPAIGAPSPETGYMPASALNIMSGESFPVNYLSSMPPDSEIPAPGSSYWRYDFTNSETVKQVTIPLDSYIEIELLKPVMPGQVLLGGSASQLPMGYTELLPPVKGISRQVQHTYTLTVLNIYAWDATSASWGPYNVYEAVTAIVNGNTGGNYVDLATLPPGYWQFMQPNTYNKIRLLSQNMFSFTNKTDTATTNLDGLNFKPKDIFCYDEVTKEVIVNWKGETLDTNYPEGNTIMMGNLAFDFNGLSGSVQNDGSFGNSLHIATLGGSLLIEFPEAVTTFEIDFGANQNNLSVYPIVTGHLNFEFGITLPFDTRLSPLSLSSAQQNRSLSYNHLDQPVNKVLIIFTTGQPVDFDGNLVIGSYFQLPDQFLPVTTPQFHHEYDAKKTLMYVSLYDQSFSAEEVVAKQYNDTTGLVGRWPMTSNSATAGTSNGFITGSPDAVPGFYQGAGAALALQNVYSYISKADGLVVPYNSALKVETGSFAFEVTAIFNPYLGGISTLLSKIGIDPVTGYQKGYALHLYQQTPGNTQQIYNDPATVPSFDIWFTCYNGLDCSGIHASAPYTLDYTNAKLLVNQYKRILVSVDRTAGMVTIYVDREHVANVPIPAELALLSAAPLDTYIDQVSYLVEELQAIRQENGITEAGFINEIEVLSNNLNKTIQPVWRPNTTFAITVSATDTVDNGSPQSFTQIFGFRTAGPVGLFQQQSAVYQTLLGQDRADEFKLADLTGYIDYDRSFPDAQGRYNLSKPVLFNDPQINLFFILPYLNAMYSDWDSYQGLPAVQSSLQVELLDPYKNVLTPELEWTTITQVIDDTNYTSLPQDQQLLFLLDKAASGNCSIASPSFTLNRTIKQGSWHFPALSPGKLYTAIFNAVYQPAGQYQQVAEVHKYSFLSSIFATFQAQASSLVLDGTPGTEVYAVYPINLAFTPDQVTSTLIPLLNSTPTGDSPLIAQYGVQYDRIIYGGMQIKAFEPSQHTIINTVVNTDPVSGSKTILGIIIRNPEPFNDPKLPADKLADTIQPTLTLADSTVILPGGFLNFYSGDTSAVFITNANMQLSAGSLQVYFRYKIYNGVDYDSVYEEYTSPAIAITAG
ncbi:MAG: hypothetical protein ACHQIM_00400 [Sphingobacteriales bacterium]